MAALAHLSVPAPSKPPADPSAEPHDTQACVFSAESACARAPLTSEPPLPDAEPLTSEPPLAEAAPLTSESDAFGAGGHASDPYGAGSYESGAYGARP
ncbi:hypothetical protein ACQPXS_18255 [Streptomyces sp. CA-142005]|uniref:hypothetical protein n=1 Tax=Streptomyces sp. CA-142005 TaxID=3240052 RepID=UPI003D8B01C7